MLQLSKIFYDAITSDAELMQAIGGRVKSTCFEVSPEEKDNTPLPYIVIRDLGRKPSQTTKDDTWIPSMWTVGAGIEVGAISPNDVFALNDKVIEAIGNYIYTLASQGKEIPYLNEGFPATEGVQWDWIKPCYWDVVQYQCDVNNTDDDEQE